MHNHSKVIVGMSGGVDSSVTAALLKEQGYQVIGMFMKNWEEKDEQGVCKSSQEYEDVVRVCGQLDIPCYTVNFVKQYWDNVFTEFLSDFKAGHTPNPDILCNREIKFKVFFEKAMELGGDYLATGHYCQNSEQNGRRSLVKGSDPNKDQSYFLYTIKEEVLRRVLFPVGHLKKSEVRQIARKYGLATSEKKDSTGICFIGKRDFKEFLSGYLPGKPGNFVTMEGRIVGKHDGAAYYTIGQRRGLAIGGPGEPWFVLEKDIPNNVVFVGQGTHHPALFCDYLTASELHWVSGLPPSLPFACKAKIRYRQPDQPCRIAKCENGTIHVEFETPQRAVTIRQSIVFYDGETCLGGGMISSRGPSYYDQKRELPAGLPAGDSL